MVLHYFTQLLAHCRTKYVLLVCALEKVSELTKKFLQRSHLVLLQVKHPTDGNVIDSGEPFLHLEDARISLRFLDLRKDEIMELYRFLFPSYTTN